MEYSLDFSRRLIDAAEFLKENKSTEAEVARTIAYLSRLSCEISLKALLEQAGFSIRELKNRSHNFEGLLRDICSCELSVNENSMPLSASRLLAEKVVDDYFNGTVGALLQAESEGGSQYPNQIRYGDNVKDYPPLFLIKCALVVHRWAEENIAKIKRKP